MFKTDLITSSILLLITRYNIKVLNDNTTHTSTDNPQIYKNSIC